MWWLVKSFQDVERVYSSLLSELPEIIKDTSYSLSNLDMEILEKCSLMDMLLCQFMMYLVESWNGEIPYPVYNSKKKKGRLTDDVFSGDPIVFSFSYLLFHSLIQLSNIYVEFD